MKAVVFWGNGDIRYMDYAEPRLARRGFAEATFPAPWALARTNIPLCWATNFPGESWKSAKVWKGLPWAIPWPARRFCRAWPVRIVRWAIIPCAGIIAL